jgi:hypothetical protein
VWARHAKPEISTPVSFGALWCALVRSGALRARLAILLAMLTATNRVKRLKNSKVLVKFSTRATPLARRVMVIFGCLWLSLVAFG